MNAVERLQAAIDKLDRLRKGAALGVFLLLHDDPIEFDLATTLYRTIDAQLAILRSVLLARNIEQNWDTLVYTTDALALADAILGES